MYKVIERFRDLTDGHLYEAGETFPHDGHEIDEERLTALESGRNAAYKPFIVKVEETIAKTEETPKKPVRGRKKAQ